jgi:hypothetical protein
MRIFLASQLLLSIKKNCQENFTMSLKSTEPISEHSAAAFPFLSGGTALHSSNIDDGTQHTSSLAKRDESQPG